MDTDTKVTELEARVEALETLVKNALTQASANPLIRQALKGFGVKLP